VNTAQDVTLPAITVWTPNQLTSTWTIDQNSFDSTMLCTLSAFASDNLQLHWFNVYIDGNLVDTGSSGSSGGVSGAVIMKTLYASEVGYGTHTLRFAAADWTANVATKSYTLTIQQPGGVASNNSGLLIVGLIGAIAVIVAVVAIAKTKARKNETEASARKTEPKTVTESIICPYCGHRNNANAKFCRNCGSSISPPSNIDQTKS
jgi:ribosomal protein L40E